MSEFSNKIVVVTGAAGNLGRAVAQAYANHGARIALVDINEEGLKESQSTLAPGTTSIIVPTNLLEADSVAEMAETVKKAFGNIEILANIAGGFTMGPLLHETPDRSWDFMMGLNARSVFHTARAVIPQMLDGGTGRIVNISARAAKEGKAKMGPYCASKAAVITLTETLAAEQKFNSINVNAILPGTIDTPQNRGDMPDADYSKWVPPEALADVVLFLTSHAARCVTGAAVPVYGQS